MLFALAVVLTLISIPALREEGDCSGFAPSASPTHFYPRPP